MKETILKIIKLTFSLSIIFLIYFFKLPYILGFIMGQILIGYLFLFPSPFGLLMLDKIFNYSDKMSVKMKCESENYEKEYNKYKHKQNKRKVKYRL